MARRVAGDCRNRRGSWIDGRSSAFQSLGGKVERRREHAVQIELIDLAALFSLGRLEHRRVGDGIRLPLADIQLADPKVADSKHHCVWRATVLLELNIDAIRHLFHVGFGDLSEGLPLVPGRSDTLIQR